MKSGNYIAGDSDLWREQWVYGAMGDEGSSVTLIFYRINPRWWTEPALNLASAVAQMSNLTHCEVATTTATNAPPPLPLPLQPPTASQISIGEDVGVNGTMKHVARVFNDNVCPCPLRCRALRARRRRRPRRELHARAGGRRARGADGAQPTERLRPARLQQGSRAEDAALRQGAVRGQAF